MPIEVTIRHVEVPEEVKEHARSCATTLEDAFPRLEHVHVIVEHQSYRYTVEIVVRGKNHLHFTASTTADAPDAAIEGAKEKMERHLRRDREKIQSRRGKVSAAEFERAVAPNDSAEDEDI